VNLLRNGNFEEGTPGYPPRGWTVKHPRTHDPGWPGWSQEDSAGGSASLRIVRPKDSITLRSQPMRLRHKGMYRLQFKAKGTATEARVMVSGQSGTSADITVQPSTDWHQYSTELNAQPGYCTVSISCRSGGAPDQVLWVDDMEFGPIDANR